jgi:hypothetical protein
MHMSNVANIGLGLLRFSKFVLWSYYNKIIICGYDVVLL